MGDGEVISWQKTIEYGIEEGNSAWWRAVVFFNSSRVHVIAVVLRAEDGGNLWRNKADR